MVLLRVRNGASAVSKAFQGPFLQDFEVAGNRFQPPPLNIVDGSCISADCVMAVLPSAHAARVLELRRRTAHSRDPIRVRKPGHTREQRPTRHATQDVRRLRRATRSREVGPAFVNGAVPRAAPGQHAVTDRGRSQTASRMARKGAVVHGADAALRRHQPRDCGPRGDGPPGGGDRLECVPPFQSAIGSLVNAASARRGSWGRGVATGDLLRTTMSD